MLYYIETQSDGRINAFSPRDDESHVGDGTTIDVPDDFDMNMIGDYLYVDGELVHDPLPEAEPVQTMEDKLAEIQDMLDALAGVR